MRRTDDKPNALRAATAPGLFENLQAYAVQMEKIQRSLEVKLIKISGRFNWDSFIFYNFQFLKGLFRNQTFNIPEIILLE